VALYGGEVAQYRGEVAQYRGEVAQMEERWLNGSAPDCKSVVLGSNPAPPQHTANCQS
jgi:hypothetical protein